MAALVLSFMILGARHEYDNSSRGGIIPTSWGPCWTFHGADTFATPLPGPDVAHVTSW